MKKFISMSLCCLLLIMISVDSFAAQAVEDDGSFYLIINEERIVLEGEDYENPETGEYIRWENNARGLDKSFSFKIKNSVTSSSFKINGATAIVRSFGEVVDSNGSALSEYTSQRYTVDINGASFVTFNPLVGYTTSKMFDFVDGGTYWVKITNPFNLKNKDAYLEGYGTITSQ